MFHLLALTILIIRITLCIWNHLVLFYLAWIFVGVGVGTGIFGARLGELLGVAAAVVIIFWSICWNGNFSSFA